MAGFPKGVVNLASDLYTGATKGAKKASWTVNKVANKNRMAQNLDVTKTINKSKNIIKKNAITTNSNVKVNNIKRTPRKNNFEMNPSLATQAGNWAGGGTRESINAYKKMNDGEKSILGAIKQGHKKIGPNGKPIDEYDMGKIAGTAFSVGVAGRIATGGGLYRDRYGNTNLPGIPFI